MYKASVARLPKRPVHSISFISISHFLNLPAFSFSPFHLSVYFLHSNTKKHRSKNETRLNSLAARNAVLHRPNCRVHLLLRLHQRRPSYRRACGYRANQHSSTRARDSTKQNCSQSLRQREIE